MQQQEVNLLVLLVVVETVDQQVNMVLVHTLLEAVVLLDILVMVVNLMMLLPQEMLELVAVAVAVELVMEQVAAVAAV